MGTVGGSRHYVGGGLGMEAGWKCPRCGAENQGPIAQGCTQCGSGAPGRHIGQAPPPPPAPEPAPPTPDPTRSVAEVWLDEHPDATLEEAFTAGYVEGIREARRAQRATAPSAPQPFTPELAVNRTIVAALELFRDQVLAGTPEEVLSGEWLSAEQVTSLIRQIQGEVIHHAG